MRLFFLVRTGLGIPLLLLGLLACDTRPTDDQAADLIFFGQHILTMDSTNPSPEAVAIKGADIVFVGSATAARKHYAGPQTRQIELGDKALLPGFIDAHGHFTSSARFINLANLSSPPVGEVTDMKTLVQALKTYVAQSEPVPEWIIGYGYDDSLLAEKRHPNRDDLDQVSDQIPITVIHVSYHFATLNSPALLALNVTEQSKDPKGGLIRRRAGSSVPNGVLEETAAYPAFYRLRKIPPEQLEQNLRATANYYASYGVTTAQDGAANPQDLAFLRSVVARQPLPIDVAFYQHLPPTAELAQFTPDRDYQNGLKLAGVKFILDGSPQGRTAWLTEPYELNQYFSDQNYRAYSTVDKNFYQKAVQLFLGNNIQVISHANGDAAIDLMLETLEKAMPAQAMPDHRSVIIHAQLMRQDQIARAKKLAAIPSFFSAHPFFWGDWHVLNFGQERANRISPTRSAKAAGLKFTIHNDAPVIPPDVMRLIWVTVNRTTRSGLLLGREQRLKVTEALQAVTIDAAYQGFEENRKGSIRAGKQADLVVLEQNPVKADPAKLHRIKVLETIARGQTIYRK